jgi:tRNA uridine 5-carbamoylmethylation protein Kti12
MTKTRPQLNVMMGLPAVGKTYIRGRIESLQESTVYSIQPMVSKIAAFCDISFDEAWDRAYHKVKTVNNNNLNNAINENRSVIVDQANLKKAERSSWLGRVVGKDYHKTLHYVRAPAAWQSDLFSSWKTRLRLRAVTTSAVSQTVLDALEFGLELPEDNEGFDTVIIYSAGGDVISSKGMTWIA